MDQVQIWKERYDALTRWVDNNVTEEDGHNLYKCKPGALDSLHLERIKYLEAQIEKYEQEISILKMYLEGRGYDS